ncbi:MAG: hypothetical protein RMA76_04900 [Deltaproteobacteria bacterium]|jgi:hypothetical protein
MKRRLLFLPLALSFACGSERDLGASPDGGGVVLRRDAGTTAPPRDAGPEVAETPNERFARLHCERVFACGCSVPVADEAECRSEIGRFLGSAGFEAQLLSLSWDQSCYDAFVALAEDPARRCNEAYPNCFAWHGTAALGEECGGREVDETDVCAAGLDCVRRVCEPFDEVDPPGCDGISWIDI